MTFLIQGNTVTETWSQSTDKRTTRFCRERERERKREREMKEIKEKEGKGGKAESWISACIS